MKVWLLVIFITGLIFGQLDYEKSENEEDEFKPFEGKIIRSIRVSVLDITNNPLVSDSSFDTSWLEKAGNFLHINTKDWVVKNYLLFSVGDAVDATDISETERLLRASNFAIDAKITIQEAKSSSDSVDITIVTKDKWTLLLLVAYGKNNSSLGIKDDNILGLGHKIDMSFTHNPNPIVGSGFSLKYDALNVAGTYFDAFGEFSVNKKRSVQAVAFNRGFITTESEWAGGFDISYVKDNWEFVDNDSLMLVPFSTFKKDLWGGRQYQYDFVKKLFGLNAKLVTSARILNYTYGDINSEMLSTSLFNSSTTYLFSIGLIKRAFYKDFYVDGFGHTEDIPLGNMYAATVGFEDNKNENRVYANLEALVTKKIYKIGYVSAYSSIGGYRNSHWQQNFFNTSVVYHTPLISGKRWKSRYFVNMDYLLAFNRFKGEQVYLDNERRIRGLERYTAEGNQRLVLNTEARIFAPFQPLGFSIAGVLFADLGLLSQANRKLYQAKLYQSYGGGIRFNNELISKANFEVTLAYNPYNPKKKNNSLTFLFSSNFILEFKDFNFAKPKLFDINNY